MGKRVTKSGAQNGSKIFNTVPKTERELMEGLRVYLGDPALSIRTRVDEVALSAGLEVNGSVVSRAIQGGEYLTTLIVHDLPTLTKVKNFLKDNQIPFRTRAGGRFVHELFVAFAGGEEHLHKIPGLTGALRQEPA